MMTAFSTALSALNAESTAIDVVGNNLANINTTGYKESTAEFYDLMSQTEGATGATQIGVGVGTPYTERVFSQGATQSSQSPLAVAIQGQGFLIAQSQSGNGTLYTRDGDLTTNSTGYLMTANGDYVQGWSSLNGTVNTSGAIGNIVVPTGSLKTPTQSTEVSLTANLDSTKTSATATATATDIAASSYSTSMTVYDSLGNAHIVDLTFTPVAPTAPATSSNQWTVTADLDGPSSGITAQVSGGSNGAATQPAVLTFDSNGVMETGATTPANANWAPLSITFGTGTGAGFTALTNGALPSGATIGDKNGNIALNLTDSSGNPTVTQYAKTSGVSAESSDGNPAVNLTGVAIANGGSVVATYSDGTQVTVGQLALATFQNPDSLLAVGNNEYQPSGLTSKPTVGMPNSGGRGQILGGNLESSTVDIASEFTNLLVFQQGYQANSKVITTANQMSQAVINLIQ